MPSNEINGLISPRELSVRKFDRFRCFFPGLTCIHNMPGGITAWEKLGLPLEKTDKAKKAAAVSRVSAICRQCANFQPNPSTDALTRRR